MLKKILVFLLPLAALFPDADMMSDFAGDPLAIVESSVNVITGDFVVRRDDLIVKGHEPICIPLNYSPKNVKHTIGRYGGWDFAENYLTIHLDYTDTFRVYEKSGLCLEYFYNLDCVNRNSAKPFTLNQDFAGWANTFLKDISARNNPMNNVVYSKPQKPQRIIIECPDGSKRYYWTDTSHQTLKKCGINRSAPIEFRLQKEKLPNGNKIFYHWKKLGGERWRVKRIESQSLDGSVYAWVSIRYEPEHDKHRKGIEFVTSDGRSIKYQFDSDYNLRGKRISLLKNVNYSFKPSIKYHYYQSKKSEIYPEWIESPDMRRMHIRYYEKGYNGDSGVALEHKDPVKDARYARVEALYQPLFQTEKVYRSHLFRYSPGKYGKGEGSTDVFDAQMNLTRYDYNHNFLMKFILRYFDENKLFSKEVFNWTENNWLQTRALVGEDNIPLYAVKYGYDQYGNIQRECHYGNLTGTKDPHCLILEGTKIECYTGDEFIISRSYNDQHLLIQETFPNGKVINYRYLKDTNLLCAKIEKDTKYNHQRRTFYFYNNSILIGEVVDNGHEECWDQLGGVTERLIKSIQPNLHKFMYGMPYVIEEKYKDKQSGEEVLLSKQVIHYDTDQYGNASRIDHYDAHGEFLYTLNFTYDGRDRLASQTDPVGRKRTFEYDANHNPTLDHNPNENFTLTQKYDYMNRPILTEQKTPEGATRYVINRYNALGHKVEEEDFRGIIIKQDYNPFGYPIQTIFPDMMTDQGKKSPVIRRTFNAMGKPLTETDPEGHTTQTWYTARGRPCRILHPDGSEEFFTYDASGYNITSHTSAGRVCTTWDYDAFDRMTEKRIFSFEGNLLLQEAFTYDAFNLLSKTDPDGVVTTYEYDGAGRKIREETLGRVIAYEYDSRGHLHRVVRNEEQILVKEYDLLDRVTEERHEDKDGLIYSVTTYTYDDFSNTIALTKEVQVGESIERLFYDPFRRLIKGIDPMGHTTTIDYDDYYKNELGQKVLRKITTDPMGRKTLETFDVFGNLVSLEKQNASGKTLVHEAFFYNLNQKKTKQVSTLFDPDKTIIKTWDYDSRSRLIELREAVGEPIEKVTHYTYTLDGHLETITKPDGKTITYTYDGLGRQTSIHTSDGSCHYTLKYDQMGYVLESHDLIHGKVTKRTYSHFGELLSETQANHQSLENTYDSLGRRTAMSFANGSRVLYDYTPYHMEKVERISSSGTSLYTHYYTEYDRSFNLTEERLLSKEPLYHTVDLLSRRIESDSPYSNERITYIDPCGNVRGYKRTLDGAVEASTFEYDDLNQLVQESGLYNHNYTYDAHYNRLQKDDSIYNVNLLHELESASQEAFEHDLNGNRISSTKDRSQYTYDGLDRLVQMRSGDLAIRFSYDSWNRCQTAHHLQLNEGVWQLIYTQDFLYDEQNELGVYPHQLRILGQGKGAEIGAAIAIEQNHKIYLPIHDLFGNIIALLDPKTNEAKEYYRYTVFGEEQIFMPTGTQVTDSLLHNPWRYQSKRKVGQLVAFGRRFYDPETGRWISPDPKGFDEGPNLYQFLLNCPMLHFDLYGASVQKLESLEQMERAVRFDDDFERRYGGPQSVRWDYFPDRDYSQIANHPLVTGEKRILCIGGINTSFEEHKNNVRYLSKLAGDMPIYSVYNASRGIKRDLEECKMGLNLIGTTPARLHYESKMDFFSSSDKSLLSVDFSQGAILGNISQLMLPEQYRQRAILIAIAPGVFSPQELWKKSFYYCTKNDLVPKLQKVFGKIPPARDNITYVDTGKVFDVGHKLSHEVYSRYLKDHFEDYIKGAYD